MRSFSMGLVGICITIVCVILTFITSINLFLIIALTGGAMTFLDLMETRYIKKEQDE